MSREIRPEHYRASYILRHNIRTLLAARKEDQKTLAQWCRHSKSWMNKFLKEGRGIQIKDLDLIADFFGLMTHQLFQPGISALTERRADRERRSGQDRRIGHVGRTLATLKAERDKLPSVGRDDPHVSAASSPRTAVARAVARVLDDARAARDQTVPEGPHSRGGSRKRAG